MESSQVYPVDPNEGACCPEFARTGYAHTEICPAFARNDPARVADSVVTADPAPRLVVGTESHPFVGDGTLCTGRLGSPDGPLCGNGPTAPIHTKRRPEPAPLSQTWEALAGRPASPLATVTRQLCHELRRAQKKLPDQHLPNGTGKRWDANQAGLAREKCKLASASGQLTWRDVLTEDYFEALAETDPAKLRAELIQVAAVALRWVQDIDLGPDRPTVIPPDPDARYDRAPADAHGARTCVHGSTECCADYRESR